MNKEEMIEKLLQAQRLLADVYGVACDNPETMAVIERVTSCADGCIYDALNALENL